MKGIGVGGALVVIRIQDDRSEAKNVFIMILFLFVAFIFVCLF